MLEQVMADNGFPVPLVRVETAGSFSFTRYRRGVMTQYDLFPGVSLMYNDFHMESYDSAFRTTEDLLCIDYCRQGRMEYPAGPDAYSYVEAGDLKLDRAAGAPGPFYLPSCPLSRDHRWLCAPPGRPIAEGVDTGISGGSGPAPE